MEEEKNCKHCHKPLTLDYLYCPYCGTSVPDDHEFVKPGDNEVSEENDSLDKLDVLEACLDVLDSEISKFLASHIH